MEGKHKITPMVIWRIGWIIPYLCIVAVQVVVAFIGFGYKAATSVWENRYAALVGD